MSAVRDAAYTLGCGSRKNVGVGSWTNLSQGWAQLHCPRLARDLDGRDGGPDSDWLVPTRQTW